jgi:hypothetical protein
MGEAKRRQNSVIPTALHGKTIDRVNDDDREWFKANPDRTFRLREAIPFEFNSPIGEAGQGFRWRVLVARIEDGVRSHKPVSLPNNLFNDSASDVHLAQIFEQVAPPAIKDALVKKMEKSTTTDYSNILEAMALIRNMPPGQGYLWVKGECNPTKK